MAVPEILNYLARSAGINPESRTVRFIVSHRLAVAGFIISLIATVTLTITHLADAIYFEDPRYQNVELQAWMTPRYVALSYSLPRQVVMDLLEIEPGTKHPRRMDHLAQTLGLTLPELTARVRKVAQTDRESGND